MKVVFNGHTSRKDDCFHKNVSEIIVSKNSEIDS